MKSKLNGLDVLDSGSMVAHAGDAIQIFPFSDDEEFELVIRTNFAEKAKQSVRVDPDSGPKETIIEFTSPFRQGMTMSNPRPIPFAESDDGSLDYFANILISVAGVEERHTLVVSYTLFSRAAR